MEVQVARDIAVREGWLASQPEPFRREVLKRSVLRRYEKGEYLYHLDDEPGMMCGIVEGAVLIAVPHPIVGVYQGHLGRVGDWFGEVAAVHQVRRKISIEAAIPVQVLCLSIGSVQDMIRDIPSAMKQFSTLLLWNHQIALRTAVDLMIREPLPRVCARLLTLVGFGRGQTLGDGPFELPLTQDLLATMCGLSRKSVHRVLKMLEAEGHCQSHYGTIVVLDPRAVERKLVEAGQPHD